MSVGHSTVEFYGDRAVKIRQPLILRREALSQIRTFLNYVEGCFPALP